MISTAFRLKQKCLLGCLVHEAPCVPTRYLILFQTRIWFDGIMLIVHYNIRNISYSILKLARKAHHYTGEAKCLVQMKQQHKKIQWTRTIEFLFSASCCSRCCMCTWCLKHLEKSASKAWWSKKRTPMESNALSSESFATCMIHHRMCFGHHWMALLTSDRHSKGFQTYRSGNICIYPNGLEQIIFPSFFVRLFCCCAFLFIACSVRSVDDQAEQKSSIVR